MPNNWQTVLDEIKSSVKDMAFNTFFTNTKFVSEDKGVVTFSVPGPFIKSSIEKKYYDQTMKALKAAGYNCDRFEIVLDDKKDDTTIIRRGGEEITAGIRSGKVTPISGINVSLPPLKNNGLNPKYRLDNYVVGSNNDVAVGAAQAVIEDPGKAYNPYFIYGGSGFGKTHLIQAIGNEIHEKYPKMNVLYITIEQFYTDFVSSIRNKKLDDFKNKYRNIDVLIVDDFQFIQGKTESQNEFFHTFNMLYENNKQVILAADRLPSQIDSVDQRLSSRLTQGITIDIQLPDFETRCAIIKAKAEFLGHDDLSDKVAEYLSNNYCTNIRDLEGGLNRLLLLADLRGVDPVDVIGEMPESGPTIKPRISARQVIDKVARYYNLNAKDLLGTSRVKDIKNARQIAMYLLNKELDLSTPKIGAEFKKDHTTIMHGIRVVDEKIKTDFNLREQITELRSKVYAN